MGHLLRFRPEQGQRWREKHSLIQIEMRPGQPATGAENAWKLEQTVLETQTDRCRVAWKRTDDNTSSEPVGPPESYQGELWIDELGRSLPIGAKGATWSEPLFPEQPVEVSEIWSQPFPGGALMHFTLEKVTELALYLVSYMEAEHLGQRHEVRGTSRLCSQSGRVLSSTTVTRVLLPDQRSLQTVVEVTSNVLGPLTNGHDNHD